MSLFKKNSLAVALVGAVVFSGAALQGCSSDEQNTPASGGSSGSAHAGSAGTKNTAGTAGRAPSDGGAAGEEPTGTAGVAGEMSMGGEGGGGPTANCDLSFDNSTLSAITDNGGDLPPLP
ncbi:MAG TPA: hypothetical protein VER12_05660 [Polyangiaceae bacterium]|nr:hypothetical protein [Polyangiaceae bacterium]